jgi:chromosomal replication initiator protein
LLIKKLLCTKLGKDNISVSFVVKPRKIQKQESGPLFHRVIPERNNNTRIKKDYTFETFAVSESNQLAYTAAQAVASKPGSKYNPLFLYGTVGVGKTHLMHAVGNAILQKNEAANIAYLTTEEFTNEVIESIKNKTTPQMRKRFRNLDLLLLDDIQFLSGKEKVQEELFHTFNALIDRGAQIVFSSDRPPSDIQKTENRLVSRFEGGLIVDIEPPNFELRCAILLIKSEKHGLTLPMDCIEAIAERITDTRALEGFLLRLASDPRAKNGVTQDLVSSLLKNTKEKRVFLKPDEIISFVCSYFNIKPTQLKGARRSAGLVLPRHVCMYLLKEEAGLTFVEIGNLLGGRDHTTVMHGVEKMQKLILEKTKTGEEIMLIKNKLKQLVNN